MKEVIVKFINLALLLMYLESVAFASSDIAGDVSIYVKVQNTFCAAIDAYNNCKISVGTISDSWVDGVVQIDIWWGILFLLQKVPLIHR